MGSAIGYDCEVVIAGGGYAGLAAARALGARALVIDQHQLGAVQRSACAMPLDIAHRFGVASAVLQVFPTGLLHTPYSTSRYRLEPPYCVFDHARLCADLFAQTDARYLRARVLGVADLDATGGTVLTSAGPVRGRVLIDATGWPAVLATARRPALAERRRLMVGMEAEVPGTSEHLHFYFDQRFVRNGYAWVFPAGDTLRIGVGAYDRHARLSGALADFLRHLGYEGKACRGGLIPWFQRPATVDGIFLAGDTAGQCLPLTAEGIRFALVFGELAGELIGAVLDGRLSRAQGEARYAQALAEHWRRASYFRFFQRLVRPIGSRGVDFVARALALRPVAPRLVRRYAAWSN
ncbi:MAG: hypothetical protein ACTHMA_12050 [Thermomicrobiales bacterium]